jgi:hypothetical protein
MVSCSPPLNRVTVVSSFTWKDEEILQFIMYQRAHIIIAITAIEVKPFGVCNAWGCPLGFQARWRCVELCIVGFEAIETVVEVYLLNWVIIFIGS